MNQYEVSRFTKSHEMKIDFMIFVAIAVILLNIAYVIVISESDFNTYEEIALTISMIIINCAAISWFVLGGKHKKLDNSMTFITFANILLSEGVTPEGIDVMWLRRPVELRSDQEQILRNMVKVVKDSHPELFFERSRRTSNSSFIGRKTFRC